MMHPKLKVLAKGSFTQKEISFVKKSLSRSAFVAWLRSNYRALQGYHACRPEDIEQYFKHGLQPGDIPRSVAAFHDLLSKVGYQGEADIRETVELFSGRSDRFIYLLLDPYDFIDQASHYWIYGSEFMLCLAQNTASHLKYHLRETGIPTILTCEVPLDKLDDEELVSLYDRIMATTGNLAQMRNDIFSNYTVIVDGTLEGDHITGHEHPTERVYDAHAGQYYTNLLTECPRCSTGNDI